MDFTVVPIADPYDVSIIEGSIALDKRLVHLGLHLGVTTTERMNEQALVPAVMTTSQFHSPLTPRLTAPDVFQFEINLRHLTFGFFVD